MAEPGTAVATGQEEVCIITQDLVRIDTTNLGDGHAVGEAKAAEYLVALLAEVGLDAQTFEAAPGRTNVVVRWQGKDPDLPALLVHGHLDVVPADAGEWSVDPFAGVVKDGMLWGRGAVDMKSMIAMTVAAVRDLIRRGEQPNRDLVLAFFADEEDNFSLGSKWMVENHPGLFAGIDAAITECGGYSIEVNGRTVFLLQSGEKGMLWIRLHATGTAGHGSALNDDNAVLELAEAVSRIGREPWPVTLTATSGELIERLRGIGGFGPNADPLSVATSIGASGAQVLASIRNTVNVTMFNAGYMPNVVPGVASAFVDVRVLPGQRDQVLARIRELAGPTIVVEIQDDFEGFESGFGGPLVEAMTHAIKRQCPEAEVAPYLSAAATDNAALAQLGIKGYGFAPMLLPPDFDLPAQFHGVDERVPLDALVFGQAVLTDLFRNY